MQNRPEIRALVRLQRTMGPRYSDPVGPVTFPDPLLHYSQNVMDINNMDGRAENLCAGGLTQSSS
ncbi:MAG: hypothetical protein ABSF14_12085 [Terriglobia bacterium]|jgi:hypothetical protein